MRFLFANHNPHTQTQIIQCNPKKMTHSMNSNSISFFYSMDDDGWWPRPGFLYLHSYTVSGSFQQPSPPSTPPTVQLWPENNGN